MFMVYYKVTGERKYTVSLKKQQQTSVHIFAKYWPIFNFFHRDTSWKICNNVKHPTTS